MGQASNAQREPSMEEILASIRKIIEDTDGAPPGGETEIHPPAGLTVEEPVGETDVFAEVPREPPPLEAAPDDDNSVEAFREAFQDDAESEEASEQVPTAETEAADEPEPTVETEAFADPEPAAEPEDRPFSLSDVQRRLMRDRVESAPAAQQWPPADPVDPPDAEQSARPEILKSLEPATEPATFEASGEETDEPADDAFAATPAPIVAEASIAETDSDEDAFDTPAPRQSIVSAAAGRQVAGAFDELKEAFQASRQRTFDEMAEEMMRPMLQEWLDNNLPVLVERLVREEIERIARGD